MEVLHHLRKTLLRPLLASYLSLKMEVVVLTDTNFHAHTGDPTNLKLCPRGSWNVRMLIETVLSMLTTLCHFKKVSHRVWAYFKACLAFTMAAFNILVQWHGLLPDEDGVIHLAIAEFSL